ncbi:cytidylyltransferase domain-containing protein [Tenacibaculum sp.]|uniref:acylneuraminate cytidylyltransferase family protein n=1 Tax=Tenacibaculum sp. TaxID=1906242 RepID=UPI003D148E7D
MKNSEKILAIIPARKGSKRIKNKNTIDFCGKPLIQWTFDSLKDIELIDKIVLTTDDNEVIKLGETLDYIEVPFIRPDHLSGDTAKSIDVINHVLDFYREKKVFFDYIMLLQPTSPLRLKEDIVGAINMILKKTNEIEAVVSVCESGHSPLWMNTLPDDLSMKEFINTKFTTSRSQDLPKYYRLNGAIFISKISSFEKNLGFYGEKTFAYKMPISRSIDIDTKIDLELGKIYMNENSKDNS